VRWRIHHTTSYRYSAPVFLEPHVIRLTPAAEASQRVLDFGLQITPAPVGQAHNVDTEGNDVVEAWFEGETRSLVIQATATVEALRPNPFDYLWAGGPTLPISYPALMRHSLAPYLAGRETGSVAAIADAAAILAEGEAQAFPLTLAATIHQACRQVYREEGDPLPAAQTLSAGEGSCRDLTQVYLEASRCKGFAARFVSGYLASEQEDERELHAWAELYLPGGGWRGFDPTSGLAVADHHIPVARAATARLAAPVSGSFRGRATATLKTSLDIRPV
jgi:transglutaminase-like putative cysteine protease